MRKITYNEALWIVVYGMLKNLFALSCVFGSLIYFVFLFYGIDISYERCFATFLLIRSLYMGILTFVKHDELLQVIDEALEKYNKDKV